MNTEVTRDQIMTWEDQHESGVYGKQPLVLVRGKGARVWDMDGTEYIDCVGGHGAAVMGHAHPAVVAAVKAQSQRLFLAPNGFYNDMRARLLAELVQIMPPGLDRVFLSNSGAEAVEAALKFARLGTGRTKVISTMRAFHGRTMGALATTWRKEYREPFEPLIPDVEFVPFDRLVRMEKAIDDTTAAVIVEVVQGEGGINLASAEFLQGTQTLCQERGALLIVDEIQTGVGRTGKFLACEHFDLRPDMITIAKGIAGGVPMGATLIGERVGEIPGHVHGSTFGGNPLSCAAALATLQTMKTDRLPDRAAKLGARLLSGLQDLDASVIREVRGLGLMVGVELRARSGSYLAVLAEQGVLALPAGSTVMRFLPPLVIEEDEIEAVIEKVGVVLAD